MKLFRGWLLGQLALVAATQVQAALLVGAAANLTQVLDPLAAAFREEHPGAQVELVLGASGTLYAQIRHGAPLDVFLSADTEYPKRLADAGLADPKTLVVFARGRLAFWSTRHAFEGCSLESALRDPTLKRIAYANPATAPYGVAARRVLERVGLWDPCPFQLVTGENIAQTAQFVESGNADAGFVALSLLRSPKLKTRGSYLLVPESWHEPLEHAAVLTVRGSTRPEARAFLGFLSTPRARRILADFGYETAGERPGS